jgi:hypothetical protein
VYRHIQRYINPSSRGQRLCSKPANMDQWM